MKNQGKVFENEWKASKPDGVLLERLNDGSASWSNGNNTRFQAKNPCDYIMFDGERLYYLELKSTNGKSLPLGNIKKNQVDGLNERSIYYNVRCGFVVKFKDVEKCFYMSIKQYNDFVAYNTRKSIPLDYFENRCIEVEMKKKVVNFTYNIKKMIKEIK